MLARSTACRHGEGRIRGEGDVDEAYLPIPHQDVGRLHISMRQTRIPKPADHEQPVVDHRIVDDEWAVTPTQPIGLRGWGLVEAHAGRLALGEVLPGAPTSIAYCIGSDIMSCRAV